MESPFVKCSEVASQNGAVQSNEDKLYIGKSLQLDTSKAHKNNQA